MPDVACRTAPPCPFALAACSIFKRPTPPSPPPTDVLLHPLQLHDPARHQGVCCGLCAGSHRRRALKTPQNDAAALVLHRGGGRPRRQTCGPPIALGSIGGAAAAAPKAPAKARARRPKQQHKHNTNTKLRTCSSSPRPARAPRSSRSSRRGSTCRWRSASRSCTPSSPTCCRTRRSSTPSSSPSSPSSAPLRSCCTRCRTSCTRPVRLAFLVCVCCLFLGCLCV